MYVRCSPNGNIIGTMDFYTWINDYNDPAACMSSIKMQITLERVPINEFILLELFATMGLCILVNYIAL